MDIAISKYIKLVFKRDTLLKNYCNGKSWEEVCIIPETKDWYKSNISCLDSKIILIANRIILEYKLPCMSPVTLSDVYSNQILNTYVAQEYYKPNSEYIK